MDVSITGIGLHPFGRFDGVTVTDEAMAVERLGHPVAAIPGSAANRKLTTPEDLAWAEALLAREARP